VSPSQRSLGPGACELGRTRGYYETGIWVAEGCSGDFALRAEREQRPLDRYTPAAGFKVADTEHGDLSVRAFTYVQYLNQSELDPTYRVASAKRASHSCCGCERVRQGALANLVTGTPAVAPLSSASRLGSGW
jgi:hypothetical protein